VAEALAGRFVPVRLDIKAEPELARRFHVLWTPTLTVRHPAGIPAREWAGFLPPGEFLAELALAEALVLLRSARPGDALERLRGMRARFGATRVAPEAMFWEGVADYRRGGDKERLWAVWRELVAAHPDSAWAVKTTLA
jgi:hypothetical protein